MVNLLSRETLKVVSFDKIIKEDIIFNKEEITKYTVDKKNKSITVDVVLTGDDTVLIDNETHRFFNSDFIDEPKEVDLWVLIDKKRGVI